VRRLLEIGFGSGIFLPELAERCDELYGIDVHDDVDKVQSCLHGCGVAATLSKQSASNLDFPKCFFDVIVSVSTLEFIESIDRAVVEIDRVLTPAGRLICVMPNKSALLDFALHVVTGEDAERDYEGRRERVLPALRKHFRVTQRRAFSPIYVAYELEKLSG
jgi:ubiquinone/menaquinone biosynthesis C-methylase UbiE